MTAKTSDVVRDITVILKGIVGKIGQIPKSRTRNGPLQIDSAVDFVKASLDGAGDCKERLQTLCERLQEHEEIMAPEIALLKGVLEKGDICWDSPKQPEAGSSSTAGKAGPAEATKGASNAKEHGERGPGEPKAVPDPRVPGRTVGDSNGSDKAEVRNPGNGNPAVQLKLSEIQRDAAVQMRVKTDQNTVEEYSRQMRDGADFPAVNVFHDGSDYWLSDGFHRVEAAIAADLDTIKATLHQGTRRDATLFAAGANGAHGLRRTNDDKRKAVMALLTDDEWSQWSDGEIARRCSVSDHFVAKVRSELSPNGSEMGTTRKVKRGDSEYTMETGAIGARADQAPDADMDPGDELDDDSVGGAEDEEPTTDDASPVLLEPRDGGAGQEGAEEDADAVDLAVKVLRIVADVLDAVGEQPASKVRKQLCDRLAEAYPEIHRHAEPAFHRIML